MNAPADLRPAENQAAHPVAQMIALDRIVPSTTHIQELRRSRFTEKSLAELLESVQKVGVLQPIVVRPHGKNLQQLEIVAGERRWLAAQAANLAEIPATVRNLSDLDVLKVQLIENLQREGLHEMEEAEGYSELMKLEKCQAEDIAAKVGKSRSYVYGRLKLLA